MPSEYNPNLVASMEAKFRRLNNPAHAMADAVGMLQMFPGLVGLWPGWVTNGSGQVVDVSGNNLHLSRTSTLIDASDSNLFARLFMSATTSNATHADAADFDVLGTETHVASGIRGLTFGAWLTTPSIAATQQIISKYLSASDKAYWIDIDTSGNARFNVSNTGSDSFTVAQGGIAINQYYLAVCRYDPSTELKVWINADTNTNVTSIPASIFNSSGPFRLGQRGDTAATAAGLRMINSFICAAAVPDIFIDTYFQMTAPLFGVSV